MAWETRIGVLVGIAFIVVFAILPGPPVHPSIAARPREVAMNHDFGWALGEVNAGRAARLEEWPEGELILRQEPAAGQAMTMPYLFKVYPTRGTVPWTPGQTELLAETWRTGAVPDPGAVD